MCKELKGLKYSQQFRPTTRPVGGLFTAPRPTGDAVPVRPGAAGLLTGVEYSRVRDSSWMYLTSLVNYRIGIELATVQRKLPDRDVVGLQLYSARTFHVTLFPRIYKGGQGPPSRHIYIKGNTNHHTGRRVLRNSRLEPV